MKHFHSITRGVYTAVCWSRQFTSHCQVDNIILWLTHQWQNNGHHLGTNSLALDTPVSPSYNHPPLSCVCEAVDNKSRCGIQLTSPTTYRPIPTDSPM